MRSPIQRFALAFPNDALLVFSVSGKCKSPQRLDYHALESRQHCGEPTLWANGQIEDRKMSMEAGGRASKLGDSYERLWAVQYALHVIQGTFQSLQWEPIGDEVNGVDVLLRRNDGRRIGHQLKRQRKSDQTWTVTTLRDEGVLKHARDQLDRDPSFVFVFVSSLPVPHLSDFVEQVHRANNDATTFYRDIVCANKVARQTFHELLVAWRLNPDIDEDVKVGFDLLRRMEFAVQDKSRLARRYVQHLAGLMFSGEPNNIVAVLGDYLDSQIGNDLHADQLLKVLQERGFAPRNLAGNLALPGAIAVLQDRFNASIAETLIAATPIARQEVQDLAASILSDSPPRLVFVHGQAGCGKSVVAHQLFVKLLVASVPCLPIQLHSRRPEGSPDLYGRQKLGLPASPALSLRGLAGDRQAVLILDQLDALRLTSSHSHEAWEACAALIDQGLADPRTTVVLACRTFDLENDPKIANWKRGHGHSQLSVVEKKIGYLSDEAVTSIIGRHGIKHADLTARQQLLLRTPSVLALWWNLADAEQHAGAFHNATQLMREVIRLRRQEASREHAVPEGDVERVISELVTIMDREGRLDVAEATVDASVAASALCSVGLLRRENTRITFVHQGYFDYLVAESVLRQALRANVEPAEWVKANQSLFRRDQLRQLLNLLRDSDQARHEVLLRGILLDTDVRFHLKHLALGHLSQSDPPLEHEIRLVSELVEQKDWWPHIQGTVLWNKLPWFDALFHSGHLAKWLSTWTDENALCSVLRLFRPISEYRGKSIDRLLERYWDLKGPWENRLNSVFGFDPSDDSPGMAEHRLKMIRTGEWRFDDIYLDLLSERHPERVAPLIEALVLAWLDRINRSGHSETSELPRLALRDHCLSDKVLVAVRSNSEQAWNSLAPLSRRLTTLRRMSTRGLRSIDNLGHRNWQQHHTLGYARDVVQTLMVAAVEGIAGVDGGRRLGLILSLPNPKVRGMEHTIAKGLLSASEQYADGVISWLIARPARFRLGDGHHEIHWEPARALIERFSPHCSDAHFNCLERQILEYHDSWEYRSFKRQLENLRENRIERNDWGRAQNVLLGALPFSRMSERARSAAATWRAKFRHPSLEKPLSSCVVGGWVMSPIPPDKLMFVTDRDWLKIVRGNWPERNSRRWRVHGPNVVGEASLRHFADALGNATKRDPRRFAALALKIPKNADPRYFTAILYGLSDSQVATEIDGGAVEHIIEHVGDSTDDNYASTVCRLVKSRNDVRWSDAIVDCILNWVGHTEPTVGTFTVHSRVGPDGEDVPDVGSMAINCVRGIVSSVITQFLWTRPDDFERLLPAADRLINDPHPAVRYEALSACLPIMTKDKDLAVRLAIAGCEHKDDRVLASHWLNNIIKYARSTHFQQVEPLILRMVRSPIDDVAESGAAWATACWADDGSMSEVLGQCRQGSKAQRLGVIDACADYFTSGQTIESVASILREMFDDEDAEVRLRAAGLFRGAQVFKIPNTVEMANGFVASRAFLDDPGNLLHPLSEYAGNIESYSKAILDSADRVSTSLADQTRGMSQRNAFAGDEVSNLLLRLYEHSYGVRNQHLQKECLDRWDQMLQSRVGMTDKHLRQLDE